METSLAVFMLETNTDMFVLPWILPWLSITKETNLFVFSLGQIHRCQPSRIWRDSPAFSPDVPRNETDVTLFYFYFVLPII